MRYKASIKMVTVLRFWPVKTWWHDRRIRVRTLARFAPATLRVVWTTIRQLLRSGYRGAWIVRTKEVYLILDHIHQQHLIVEGVQ